MENKEPLCSCERCLTAMCCCSVGPAAPSLDARSRFNGVRRLSWPKTATAQVSHIFTSSAARGSGERLQPNCSVVRVTSCFAADVFVSVQQMPERRSQRIVSFCKVSFFFFLLCPCNLFTASHKPVHISPLPVWLGSTVNRL